jgi:hypothetical protein
LRPAEAGESWYRQLTDTGLQLSRQPIQSSHLSYQNTPISLLREITSSLNKQTASRTESCLLAISDKICKIMYAVTFCYEFSRREDRPRRRAQGFRIEERNFFDS